MKKRFRRNICWGGWVVIDATLSDEGEIDLEVVTMDVPEVMPRFAFDEFQALHAEILQWAADQLGVTIRATLGADGPGKPLEVVAGPRPWYQRLMPVRFV